MKKLITVFLLFMIWGGTLIAQPPVTEAQARAELEKRVVLMSKSFDKKCLKKVLILTKLIKIILPKFLAAERALEEVIKELEAEKAAVKQGNPEPPPPEAEGIELENPAIQGVDVQEAVQVQQDTTEKAIEEIKASDIEATIAEEFVEEKNTIYLHHQFLASIFFEIKAFKLYRQSQDVNLRILMF